jgi:plastocyanin
MRAWFVLTVLGLVVAGGAASAWAQVSGRLLLAAYKPAPEPEAKPSYYWELENGFKEVKPDRISARRELAAVLCSEAAPVAGSDRLEVPWNGGNLLPSTLVVRVGTTILFRNDDEVAHELLGVGLATLPAEATSPRGRRSWEAAEPGSWPLRDQSVPHAKGHLHVLPDVVAIATIEADGSYSFPAVPPGKYTLKVFHGGSQVGSQEIEATAKALTVDPITLTASPADE